MTTYEIVITALLGIWLIYYIIAKLIDRKSNAKLILDLFKLMFDLNLCKIEPEEAQKLYNELYNSSFLTKKTIKSRIESFILRSSNSKKGK